MVNQNTLKRDIKIPLTFDSIFEEKEHFTLDKYDQLTVIKLRTIIGPASA